MFSNNNNASFYKEKSIISMDAVVKWKKSNNLYNFTALPKTAILTMFSREKKSISYFLKKTIKGLKGKNFLTKNQEAILCTNCSYGAPYVVSLCEELRALGVSNFIFIGLAGCINQSLNEGDLLYVKKVFSGVGVSYYYSKEEVLFPYSNQWNKKLVDHNNAKPVSCWSTDAPFRESLSLKNLYLEKGAEIVEMECAALYAFSNFYKVNMACFTIISDQLTETWKPPKNYKKLVEKEKEFIANILEVL